MNNYDPLTLTWQATITGAATQQFVVGNIFVDGQRLATQVSQADAAVPTDGELHELKVEAPGYQVWTLKLRAARHDRGRSYRGRSG